jgi:uncharacterized protein YbaR (Trm112 family)
MDPELLKILVCPKTKKKLVKADSSLIGKINKQIKSEKCRDISGEIIRDEIEEGLYQPESSIFYMVRDGIPLLIYDNAIKVDK